MAEFYSTQIAKAAITMRSGCRVVLGVEHRFDRYFDNDYINRDGGSLELSGIDRFVFKANSKPASGPTVTVKANLPAKELFRVYAITKDLLKESFFSAEAKEKKTIYAPADKYFRDQNDKGENCCYSLRVEYDPKNRMPIQVIIKNYWAPLKTSPGGTTQIVAAQSHDEEKVTMWLSVADWFDMCSHIIECWRAYSYASFTPRFQRSLKGAPKN